MIIKDLGSAKILCTFAFVLGILSFVEPGKQGVPLIGWIFLFLTVLMKPHNIIAAIINLWSPSNSTPEYCGFVTGFEGPSVVIIELNCKVNRSSVIGICPEPVFNQSKVLYLVVLHIFQGNNQLMARAIILDRQASFWDGQKYAFIINDVSKVKESYIYSRRNEIIGVVGRGSEIGKLIVCLYYDDGAIQNQDIIQVDYRNNGILYQIVNAVDHEEKVSKDVLGYTQAIAVQVGTWDTTTHCFEDFNWVPPINSLVYKAEAFPEGAACTSANDSGQMIVGTFNTGHPILIDKADLVTHNAAILGVTGSGKSCLGYSIIEELIRGGIKVICIDNTGDYLRHVQKEKPAHIIANDNEIDVFLASLDEFAVATATSVKSALLIIRRTYEWAQRQYDPAQTEIIPKVCVVIEEAHSLIPEWNSTVNPTDRDLVNQISKYVMQGRKYGCGVVVVTQRTANVTKSILSQCNTIISFQAFDKTSNDFLSSFMEEEYINNICRLNTGHAIIAGKALISGRPVAIMTTRRT
ncbi:ATP-binding protein [Anaeroselena agilis]|uniref:DUF87 domain-containing protein n=1 Tax=Anaeroselena agilis TaxID=3063788 RepID=A0ABU3NVB4_9FIRM|nr:DUF87 domain-containing protein [Selenomonadales bacterium 4137-cl]